MNKNFKPVYVRGTKTGTGVIETLTALGGINNCNYSGNNDDIIYYMMPDNYICSVSINSGYAKYIMATAEELQPKRWRAALKGSYYTIDTYSGLCKVRVSHDCYDSVDDSRYGSGNYYKTREECQKTADACNKLMYGIVCSEE